MNIRKAIIQDEKEILQIHRKAVENGYKGHYTDRQIASCKLSRLPCADGVRQDVSDL